MVTILVITIFLTALSNCEAKEQPTSRLSLFRFFVGYNPEMNTVQKISFNPEAGSRFREQYEKKYGPHGSLLIERFGQGIGTEGPSLVDVDQILQPSKNKTRHYRTEDFNSSRRKTKSGSETADITNGVPVDLTQ